MRGWWKKSIGRISVSESLRHLCKWCVGDGLKREDTLYVCYTYNTPTSLSCSWEMDSSRGPGRLFPDNVIKCIRNWNPSQYICRDRHGKWKSLCILGASRFLMIVNTRSKETKLSAWRLNSSQRAKFNTILGPIVVYSLKAVWTTFGHMEQQWMKHELNTECWVLFTSHKCVVRMAKWANKTTFDFKTGNISPNVVHCGYQSNFIFLEKFLSYSFMLIPIRCSFTLSWNNKWFRKL